MSINPIGSGPSGRIDSSSIAAPSESAVARPRPDAQPEGPAQPDRVELSAEALRLARPRAGSELPPERPERMLDIGKRLAQQYYDRPNVQRAIIEKLQNDL